MIPFSGRQSRRFAPSHTAGQEDGRKERECLRTCTTGSSKFLFIEDLISPCSNQSGTPFDLRELLSSLSFLHPLRESAATLFRRDGYQWETWAMGNPAVSPYVSNLSSAVLQNEIFLIKSFGVVDHSKALMRSTCRTWTFLDLDVTSKHNK